LDWFEVSDSVTDMVSTRDPLHLKNSLILEAFQSSLILKKYDLYHLLNVGSGVNLF
jgi:hypothetical protein